MRKIKAIVQSKVAKSGFWMVLLQGFNTIVPMITLPYITRILSTSAYGEFSLALNWVGYFQAIVEYGFGLTGARRTAICKDKGQINEICSGIVFARLLLLIPCTVAFGLVVLIAQTNTTQILCMLVLSLMVISTVFQQNWFFQGIAEMKYITITNVISRTISVVLTFLLVKSPNDLYLYCFLYVINYLISSLFGCLIARIKYKVKIAFPAFKKVIRELIDGWSLFLSSAMSKIFSGIGVTILGFFSTTEVVGVYSAIIKIPTVLNLLFAAISQALYPFMCSAFEISFNGGVKQVRKYAIPVLAFFGVCGAVLAIANNLVVKVAFGDDYAQDSTLLIPLIVWTIFGILNNFLGIQTLVASGHQKAYSLAFAISIIVMTGLMASLAMPLGAYGIALASAGSEAILSIILLAMIFRIKKKENEKDGETFDR